MDLGRFYSRGPLPKGSMARRQGRHLFRTPRAVVVAPSAVSTLDPRETRKTPETRSVAPVPLLGGVRAHESSVSAARVLEDTRDGVWLSLQVPHTQGSMHQTGLFIRRTCTAGSKLVVTASMDKTIAAWRLAPNEVDCANVMHVSHTVDPAALYTD